MFNFTGIGAGALVPSQPDRAKSGAGEADVATGTAVTSAPAGDQNELAAASELKSSGPAPGVVSGESLVASKLGNTSLRLPVSQPEAVGNKASGSEADSKDIGSVVVIVDPEYGLPVVVKIKDGLSPPITALDPQTNQPLLKLD